MHYIYDIIKAKLEGKTKEKRRCKEYEEIRSGIVIAPLDHGHVVQCIGIDLSEM